MRVTLSQDERQTFFPTAPQVGERRLVSRKRVGWGVLLGACYFCAVWLFSPESETPVQWDFSDKDKQNSWSISITNIYGGPPQAIADGFYPFEAIVEPHRVTTLTVAVDKRTQEDDTCLSWDWVISINENSTLNVLESVQDASDVVEYTFTKAGRAYGVEATCRRSSRNSLKSLSVKVQAIGKYVRRELRELTAEDREKYLDAMHTVYTTRTEQGAEKYGFERFKGFEWYTRWHLGSETALSPWHGNPSFFPAHAAFASTFEESMQAVHPSTALHFWDYTRDAELPNWEDSFMWTPEWFGPMRRYNSTYEAADTDKHLLGRWSDVTMPRNLSKSHTKFESRNSYGITTEPWNNNPSQVVCRDFSICGLKTTAFPFSGCKELLGALAKENMTEFHTVTEYVVHFEYHYILGGASECGSHFGKLATEYPKYASMLGSLAATLMTLYMDNFYYYSYYDCPDYCSLETSFEDCRCKAADLDDALSVNDGELSDDDWYKFFKQLVMDPMEAAVERGQAWKATKLKKILEMDERSGKMKFRGIRDEDQVLIMKAYVRAVGYPGKLGSYMSPLASANDPIFFPLHVNWERNWQYKRLLATYAGDRFNSHWTSDSKEKGWNYDDPQAPFDNVYGKKRKPEGSLWTNGELVSLFDPGREDLPFIFGDLSYKHCSLYDSDSVLAVQGNFPKRK